MVDPNEYDWIQEEAEEYAEELDSEDFDTLAAIQKEFRDGAEEDTNIEGNSVEDMITYKSKLDYAKKGRGEV